jgi:hypothetical protein
MPISLQKKLEANKWKFGRLVAGLWVTRVVGGLDGWLLGGFIGFWWLSWLVGWWVIIGCGSVSRSIGWLVDQTVGWFFSCSFDASDGQSISPLFDLSVSRLFAWSAT